MFRCFYCDRTTKNSTAVSVRLNNGLLSCADCSAHDSGMVFVHGWDGELNVAVFLTDISGSCEFCDAEDEPCVAIR